MSPLALRPAYALAVVAAVAGAAIPAGAQSLAGAARTNVRPGALAAVERLPRPFDDASPEYPEAMLRRNVDGDVVAEFVVAADGRPRMRSFVAVQSTDHLFASAVWDAVAQSRYIPAEAHGEPVPMAIRRVYRFRVSPGAVITAQQPSLR